MEEKKTKLNTATVVPEGVNPTHPAYISPDVALAQAGLQVEFGKSVPVPEDPEPTEITDND